MMVLEAVNKIKRFFVERFHYDCHLTRKNINSIKVSGLLRRAVWE